MLFSFHSLIIGILADKVQTFKTNFEKSELLIGLGFIWVFLVSVSLFYCFKSFRPQIERKYKKMYFFFKDAAHKFGNVDEYVKISLRFVVMKSCYLNNWANKYMSKVK